MDGLGTIGWMTPADYGFGSPPVMHGSNQDTSREPYGSSSETGMVHVPSLFTLPGTRLRVLTTPEGLEKHVSEETAEGTDADRLCNYSHYTALGRGMQGL